MPTMQQRTQERHTWRRVTTATASVVAAGLAFSACSSNAPSTGVQLSHDAPISISVNASSSEQMVLGELYHQTLQDQDRNSNVSVETDPKAQDRMARLQRSEVNFIVGCTGELLGTMNTTAAGEIVDEFGLETESSTDLTANDGELSQRTYDEFVGSLPGNVTTTDPSPAEGCEGNEFDSLPQNIVPVFHKGLFNRVELDAINSVTRSLSTDELDKLVTRARRQGSVSAVVSDWLSSSNSAYKLKDRNSDHDNE
ncbi:hypothetical protein [Corynebacterium cystitidis]|uniref:hypothetical protein n=1 Tax=Corynebacterium cystitidis TaxID=35757 RepID=UPI00211EC413|nr:hypothetical protein [Corynebacterium cystitidis]